MYRTVFEIIYLLSILYICRHYHKLFMNVVKNRRNTKTSIGFKNQELERAIRAHANFCETVPLIIILSFILYFNNLLLFSVSTLIILAVGRTIHSKAISSINEDLAKRRLGMRLTFFSMFEVLVFLLYFNSNIFCLFYQLIPQFYHNFLPKFFL